MLLRFHGLLNFPPYTLPNLPSISPATPLYPCLRRWQDSSPYLLSYPVQMLSCRLYPTLEDLCHRLDPGL